MPGALCFTVIFFIITGCSSQDTYPKPRFPDVFQTEIEGTFITDNGVVEIDASMFFDRINNRAALFVTREADLTKTVLKFDDDESLVINGNSCEVQQIPDGGFFPFKRVGGKKKLSTAEEALYFTKSKLQSQTLDVDEIPALVYKTKIDIPQYGMSNCELTHKFSKPEIELWTCRDGEYCNSTLAALSVKCKDDKGNMTLNHAYMFSRFESQIEDESVFLPPPGVHCDMKSTEEAPLFPPYFSFNFDIIQKPGVSKGNQDLFSTHKEVWYDSEYRIIRIDEFGTNGLLYSSRIFDIKAEVAFTIIATEPECSIGPIDSPIQLSEITLLPASFFSKNNSDESVYVGQRKVHGLNYDAWSRMWTSSESEARIVEEVYFLEIVPSNELTEKVVVQEPEPQISHADVYTYEMNEEEGEYQLALLKHYSINNFRSEPKEWAAFDVATCFGKEFMKEFVLKVKAPPIVKGSHMYKEVLELLYNKIIQATGISVVRISELEGIFDGVKLVEMKGKILDNDESTGWPKDSKEPRMEEALKLIQKAASDKKLSVQILEKNKIIKIEITSAEYTQPAPSESTCYSGGSMAAASLVPLIIGILFGVAGYYVFLKKRRSSNPHVRMANIENSI